jgi:hypothetical protein
MSAKHIAAILSQPLLLTLLLWTSPAFGEPLAGAMELRGTVGYSNFLDEEPLHHLVIGGSARFYVTNRLAVEPEFLFMYRSSRDIDFQVIPNVVFDFTKRESRFQPYAIGGVGLQRHRELTGTGYYWSNSWTGSAGIGTKIFLSDRLYVAPEFRLGLEPIVRITASVGYVF